jgi:hypothetical protein
VTVKELEVTQCFIICAFLALKGTEQYVPIDDYVTHFGPIFLDTFTRLSNATAKEEDLINKLSVNVKRVFGTYLYGAETSARYFFETVRPVEIQWMFLQPNRFLDLVDHSSSSISEVVHHLVFLRTLSNIELTLLSILNEEQWHVFRQSLSSTYFQAWLLRYHLFALLALFHLFSPNQEHPPSIEPFFLFFSPFIPQVVKEKMSSTHRPLTHWPALQQWISMQLLQDEADLVSSVLRLLFDTTPSTATPPSLEIKGDAETEREWSQVWNHIVQQTEFTAMWDPIQTEMQKSYSTDRGKYVITHPYRQALHLKGTATLYQDVRSYVEEVRTYQEALQQKNYYPYYCAYQSFYILVLVIFIIVMVILFLALMTYAIQQHTRILQVTTLEA